MVRYGVGLRGELAQIVQTVGHKFATSLIYWLGLDRRKSKSPPISICPWAEVITPY